MSKSADEAIRERNRKIEEENGCLKLDEYERVYDKEGRLIAFRALAPKSFTEIASRRRAEIMALAGSMLVNGSFDWGIIARDTIKLHAAIEAELEKPTESHKG